MKQKERIIFILCVFTLAFGLSSCTRRANEGGNTVQSPPAASAVEETAPAPVQSPPAASAVEAADPAPAQFTENAGTAENSSPAVGKDTVLPELEIPTASETPQSGNTEGTNNTAPIEEQQPEPYDQGSEQGAGNGIVITEGGDIVLPELP